MIMSTIVYRLILFVFARFSMQLCRNKLNVLIIARAGDDGKWKRKICCLKKLLQIHLFISLTN